MIDIGQAEHSAVTTCGYCGVGCSFKAEMRGEELVRMVPYKDGKANHGHSCVKGRFAWGYATHRDRILKPMIRAKVSDPWREVSWDEAFAYAASEFKRIQATYGKNSVGAITSSRCTNEETYLIQKLVRAGFGNNNVDTCARVCHSPTGYGLKTAFGTSAGTQDFDSVDEVRCGHDCRGQPDRRASGVCLAHEKAAAGRRETDHSRPPPHRSRAHAACRGGLSSAFATRHQCRGVDRRLPMSSSLRGSSTRLSCANAAIPRNSRNGRNLSRTERNSPEAVEKVSGVPADTIRNAARLYATGGNAAIYYGLGVTEHSQGSTTVLALANLALATGNLGRKGVGINPLRGQNNVQGACDMGSFPHELAGYRHISDDNARSIYEQLWGVTLDKEPGLRIPNMLDAAVEGTFKGIYIEGEDILQSDPDTHHVAAGLGAMECVIVQDLFLNETANYAHIFLPGSTFLEKDGTFTNAERRIGRVRKVMSPKNGYADWEITVKLSEALGVRMNYNHPSEIMDEIAATTPTFAGVSFAKLDELGSVQWPCNEKAPEGTPVMHIGSFASGKGKFVLTEYVPTDERTGARYPAPAHDRAHPQPL